MAMRGGYHVGELHRNLGRAHESVRESEQALVAVVAARKHFAARARELQEAIDRQGREIVEGMDEVECIKAWAEARADAAAGADEGPVP